VDFIIIIQARQTSTRLPRKVLLPLNGVPAVVYLYQRLRILFDWHQIIVAIPNTFQNDELAETLRLHGIQFYRGSEESVYSRFVNISNMVDSNYVVRINADCPILSPLTVFKCIQSITMLELDYLSTTLDSSYPLGEHVEIFSRTALTQSRNHCINLDYIEHVTSAIYANSTLFACGQLSATHAYPSNLRLCIDYYEDYLFLTALLKLLPTCHYALPDIISCVHKNMDLLRINGHFVKSRTTCVCQSFVYA
jgi:spore coat polysaccharide biosynthesis protein SpsF